MNIKSIFGGAAIGKDMSGNFKLSFKGLAVRTGDHNYVAKDGGHLIDVTDLTLDGTESFVYRLPVQSVECGDVIIMSETPFKVMFVQEVHEDGQKLLGSVAQTGTIESWSPATNLFNFQFFVKVVSLLDGFGGDISTNNLLPLLLLGDRGTGSKSDDSLTTLLMLQTLGGKALEGNSLLPLLLLTGNKSDGLETLLLLQGLGGDKNLLGNLVGRQPKLPSPGASHGETVFSETPTPVEPIQAAKARK